MYSGRYIDEIPQLVGHEDAHVERYPLLLKEAVHHAFKSLPHLAAQEFFLCCNLLSNSYLLFYWEQLETHLPPIKE